MYLPVRAVFTANPVPEDRRHNPIRIASATAAGTGVHIARFYFGSGSAGAPSDVFQLSCTSFFQKECVLSFFLFGVRLGRPQGELWPGRTKDGWNKGLLRNVFEKEWENNWEIRRVRVLPYRRGGFAWDGREKRQIGFGI